MEIKMKKFTKRILSVAIVSAALVGLGSTGAQAWEGHGNNNHNNHGFNNRTVVHKVVRVENHRPYAYNYRNYNPRQRFVYRDVRPYPVSSHIFLGFNF